MAHAQLRVSRNTLLEGEGGFLQPGHVDLVVGGGGRAGGVVVDEVEDVGLLAGDAPAEEAPFFVVASVRGVRGRGGGYGGAVVGFVAIAFGGWRWVGGGLGRVAGVVGGGGELGVFVDLGWGRGVNTVWLN